MKSKILGIFVVISLLALSLCVIAEDDDEPGSSSFVLDKDDELFGLESEYEGKGFGLVLPNHFARTLNYYFYTTDFRQFTINGSVSNNGLEAFHIKKVDNYAENLGTYKVLAAYEVLSTLEDDQFNYYEMVVRVDDVVNADNVKYVMLGDYVEEYYGMLDESKPDRKDHYFTVRTDQIGLFLVVEDGTEAEET